MNKKYMAMTIAEILITLVVIGVISAVAYPVINNYHPDKDAITYQKAMYNVSAAFAKATEDNEVYYCNSDWKNCANANLCIKLSDYLNTTGRINCEGGSSYDSPNFITTDGIRYWGLDGGFTEKTKTIYVDRLLSKNENSETYLTKHRDASHSQPGMKIVLKSKGGTAHSDSADFKFENNILEKPLRMDKKEKDKKEKELKD